MMPLTEVFFEETGEVRKIKSWCRMCFYASMPRGLRQLEMVSPKGVAHRGGEYSDTTHCGKDATPEGWWHKL